MSLLYSVFCSQFVTLHVHHFRWRCRRVCHSLWGKHWGTYYCD